jgi:hypothetical protein
MWKVLTSPPNQGRAAHIRLSMSGRRIRMNSNGGKKPRAVTCGSSHSHRNGMKRRCS